jgi:hypothetical protein
MLSSVIAENPMITVPTGQDGNTALLVADIANTDSLIISEESTAELFSIFLLPVVIFSSDICVLEQSHAEEQFTLSSVPVSAEWQKLRDAIPPCLELAATVDLLNAEQFTVVYASRVWDPGGPFSFFRAPRRKDDRTTGGGEIDTSLSGFSCFANYQACEFGTRG